MKLPPPVGVVLTGGASSRMGTDKAFVEVGGRPMVVRVVDALRAGGCREISCRGGDLARLAELGLVAVADDPTPDGRRPGPVAALGAALAGAGGTVVVAACDLPALTGDVVGELLAVADSTGDVAVAGSQGRRHLVAAWPTSSRPAVAAAITAGVDRYHELLDRVGARTVPVDDRLVRNVNRAIDLLEDRSRRSGAGYPPGPMHVREISVDELAELLAAGARLFDVREPAEFEEVRVPGGTLVPLSTVPAHVDDFRGDGPAYVICRSGGRSAQACGFLAGQGVEAVNVAGGTLAWIDAGHPVVTGSA